MHILLLPWRYYFWHFAVLLWWHLLFIFICRSFKNWDSFLFVRYWWSEYSFMADSLQICARIFIRTPTYMHTVQYLKTMSSAALSRRLKAEKAWLLILTRNVEGLCCFKRKKVHEHPGPQKQHKQDFFWNLQQIPQSLLHVQTGFYNIFFFAQNRNKSFHLQDVAKL